MSRMFRLLPLLALGALLACNRQAPPPPAPAAAPPPNVVKRTEAEVDASIKANTESLDQAIDTQSTGASGEPPR